MQIKRRDSAGAVIRTEERPIYQDWVGCGRIISADNVLFSMDAEGIQI